MTNRITRRKFFGAVAAAGATISIAPTHAKPVMEQIAEAVRKIQTHAGELAVKGKAR